MYAIIVGTKSGFVFDSIFDEKDFSSSGWTDILVPSWVNRIGDMTHRWNRGEGYLHPQASKPETEQLLGYSSSGGTGSLLIDELNADGFFAFVARENRHGEIHIWNTRYNAVYEFNKLTDPQGLFRGEPSWYVRTLGVPATLDSWAWTGELDESGKPVHSFIRLGTPKAYSLGYFRTGLKIGAGVRCVDTNLLWTRRHLEALRKQPLDGVTSYRVTGNRNATIQ